MKRIVVPTLAAGALAAAGCGATHTRTVTHISTVTHVVTTHPKPKIILHTKTVTVTQAPTPTQTTATTATSQNTPAQTTPTPNVPFTNAHPCGVPVEAGCNPKANLPGPNGVPQGCMIVTPANYVPPGQPGLCPGSPVGSECC